MTDTFPESPDHSKIQSLMIQVANVLVQINHNALNTETDVHLQPLRLHVQRYPQLCWIDLYKFLLQGTCGWAHLQSITNLGKIRSYLFTEYAVASSPLPSEPMVELLDVDTQIVRINLCPWKSEGFTAENLWDLMIKVAKRFPNAQSLSLFTQRWATLTSLFNRSVLFSTQDSPLILQWLTEIHKFIHSGIEIHNLPLVSHSSLYHTQYNPSYRLVWKNDLSVQD